MKVPTALSVRTYAKLNLFLRVAGSRSDGYHELETVFHGIGLSDEMAIESTTSGEIEVRFTASEAYGSELPSTGENSVVEAVRALGTQSVDGRGVRVRVHKRIPVGSGLGGGSGNAAGLIVALNELWRLGLDRRGLLAAAAAVGSDVPYCISGGTMLAMSRGEDLQPLPVLKPMTFVLGMSHRPLLTRDVYATFDELEPAEAPGSAPLVYALGAGDAGDVAKLLYNDLERAAFVLRPELEEGKAKMVSAGALGASVSGSGPTVFGVASDRSSGESIAEELGGEFDSVEVVETAEVGVEILQGARRKRGRPRGAAPWSLV